MDHSEYTKAQKANENLFMFLGPCPIGHYCPNGTTVPLGCDPGTYNDETHQATCKTCVAGYYCEVNSTTYLGTPCPQGKFLPYSSR